MTLFQVAIYHNPAARFLPYRPKDPLTLVFTFARDLPEDTAAEQIADWAFRICNVDLEALENDHATPDAEAAFPLACLYRLLRLRSMSTGDVASVTVDDRTTWLACDPFGWRRTEAPARVFGQPLTARVVRQHLCRVHVA